ncbi:hypothetical protein Lbys_3293 [Leadbetterella byssophila DSM 17132]|uniref:Uncharacterized protein n=1 Tax=Leadbetterella byssophila (strain DSM 17132 / JCM 16389 / KACC 11308 / NBRC 106382 / 4M15) TaxID=649349 RepID=E4RWL0_LEAB4|nr:hypothetical protein Lbys_3293 [Leadbetterella byssophila DSM 17132]
MTKIKYILLSSLLLIELSCKEQTLEIELQPLTVKLLEQFSLEQKSYLDTLVFYNEPVFYSLAVDKVKDETRIQMYLIENNLDVYVTLPFLGHRIIKQRY